MCNRHMLTAPGNYKTSQSKHNTHGTCRSCTPSAVSAINATIVAHSDFDRNCEVNINIEIVRRRCEVGAVMLPVPPVLDSLGSGVFFSRQLLILCDSKGPYLPAPR